MFNQMPCRRRPLLAALNEAKKQEAKEHIDTLQVMEIMNEDNKKERKDTVIIKNKPNLTHIKCAKCGESFKPRGLAIHQGRCKFHSRLRKDNK